MDIPNLSPQKPTPAPQITSPATPKYVYAIIIVIAITVGFWVSRFWPSQTTTVSVDSDTSLIDNQASKIVEGEEIKVGVVYGNLSKTFADSATGIIKSGGVNGEGTHTLERPGGVTQNAALTSSVVDLDLFVGKQVEVKGETNKSNKAAWLMDVGSIKITE
ncbi:MAG TPA: hypothetical protein PKZ92_02290 [Candidatus Woesebacteria bacterium]|jgi:hypothetical protein|nr:hypothetical protein [Candidatus Shapirobacteria bacterium]HOR02064.1 hypothetical protein [Candidatus Woesebacteria bacterium]